MNTVEKIKIMQAWLNGQKIRYRVEGGVWCYTDNSCTCPTWDWSTCVYEIAPREFWINVSNRGACTLHIAKSLADGAAGRDRIECIHVREIVDDNS